MNAAGISGSLQRQRSLAAQTMGLNPTQRSSYELQSMLQRSGDQASLMNQALMEAWKNQNQFAQNLGLGWSGQQPLPPDQSPGPADYALQLILASLLR